MKLAALCIGLFLAAPPSASPKSDRETAGLRGPVYAVKESVQIKSTPGSTHHIPFDLTPPEHHTTTYFDRNGNRTLRLTYDEGRMTGRDTFRHQSATEVFEQAEDGGLEIGSTGERTRPTPSVTRRHTYRYNEDGALAEESEYSGDGTLIERTQYKYDAARRIHEQIEEHSHGFSKNVTTTYSYPDGQSEPIESTFRSEIGRGSAESYSYEFDRSGNWTRRRTIGPEQISESVRQITYYPEKGGEGVRIWGETPNDPIQPRFQKLPMVIRKSGAVLQGSAIHRVQPTYPAAAIAAKVTGQVAVEIRIDRSGNVVSATIISGPRELQQASIDAVMGWKFNPTVLTGIPVEVMGIITFNFER